MVQAIAFYVMAAVTLIAGLSVVFARNPVHSVLFLITAFFSAAGLFVLMGAEFLAMLLVVVYVGAVAVLFLFVVMMLDVDFAALRAGISRYLPVGLVVATVLAVEMGLVAYAVATNGAAAINSAPMTPDTQLPNAETIGRVLYTDYVFPFELAAVILLVAIVAAIALTLRDRKASKYQDPRTQLAANKADRLRIVKDVK